jgi:dTDP-4-amino-4,6-dideoxygalactose transaminase
VVTLGTNGKMNEISAAMGITGLESIEDFISVNFRNYKQYRRELAGQKGIRLLSFDEQEKNNYQYIVLLVDEALTGISRDRLMKILWAENVLARRYFYPGCHRMEPYLSLYPDSGKLLPVTENAVERSLTLPTGTAVNSEDISQICQIIRLAVRSAADIKKLMCNRTDF